MADINPDCFHFTPTFTFQDADLQAHLVKLEKDLLGFDLGERNSTGLGIINMERWRPTLQTNFGGFTRYKKLATAEVG